MKKEKLRSKDLQKLGYPDNQTISLGLELMKKHCKYENKAFKIDLLQKILEQPKQYLQDKSFQNLAQKIYDFQYDEEFSPVPSYTFEDKAFKIFGEQFIEDGAKMQMKQAMSLPVSVNGALMPDAHHGYGLPIGGVLAAEKAIIPYGVGVDIGCRMCLTVYNAPERYLMRHSERLHKVILENSRFGLEYFKDNYRDDPFFDRPELNDIPFVKNLKDKAYKQIGSSGGGNHFVEFGLFQIHDTNNQWNLAPGKYLALLTHSGSRGFGASIAGAYTDIARKKRQLPRNISHLSWLYEDEAEGQEYWLAMNLAGDYASACHHHIHRRINKVLRLEELLRVENHHNFAWKERLTDGSEVYMHRKGATPAHKGTLGIIPGSMTDPAFIVKGMGNSSSLNSAAHGAGRKFSRKEARNSVTRKMLRDELKAKKVELISAGMDETPFAYKNIHEIMNAQQDLVEILASFQPKIVRMDKGKD